MLYTNSIQDGPPPTATGDSMARKKKSTDPDVLTSIARTVGTAAGMIVSTANRLKSASTQKPKPARRKRRTTKKIVKASIKPKSKTTKKRGKTTLKKRK